MSDEVKPSSQENGDQTACYANPEPPPEIQQINQDDLIGNTMFSKHWVFEVLLKLIEKVDNEDQNPKRLENDENKENNAENSPAESVVKELDPAIEKDLCDLWDMTVEKDVCNLLDEFNAMKIFEGYMTKYDLLYPRAIEILIGILANMVSLSATIANKLVKNSELMTYLVNNKLNQMNDVPVLIQVIRLLTIFFTTNYKLDDNDDETETSETSLPKYFIETYFKSETSSRKVELNDSFNLIIDNFNFIFESSLNAELLDCTCLFITNIIDMDEQILNAFSSSKRFLESVCNAAHTRLRLDRTEKSFTGAVFTTSNKRQANRQDTTGNTSTQNQNQPHTPFQPQAYVTQVSEDDISSVDHLFNKFFSCLQSISTCELGVICLSEKALLVIELLNVYLERCLATFSEWEISSSNSLKSSICYESQQNFICLISLLNCLFSNMQRVHRPKNDQAEDEQSESERAEAFDLNNKNHLNFSMKLFTMCKYYINLINETEKNQDRSPSSTDSEPAGFFQLENFEEIVKSTMHDLLECFVDFNGHMISETKNKSLFTLLNDCTTILSKFN